MPHTHVSFSLVIKDTEGKTTIKYILHPSYWQEIKSLKMPSAGEGVEL